jgi:hypothetical protein
MNKRDLLNVWLLVLLTLVSGCSILSPHSNNLLTTSFE